MRVFAQFFDEVWKDIKYGGVEGHWGLFDEEYALFFHFYDDI